MGENPAALRAAVFSLSSKNLRGGRSNAPPPAGRGLMFRGRRQNNGRKAADGRQFGRLPMVNTRDILEKTAGDCITPLCRRGLKKLPSIAFWC